jgi:Zn finger protein HypA/HybF involved in hydrogenase expression
VITIFENELNTPIEGTGSKWTVGITCHHCGYFFKIQTGDYDKIICPECKKPLEYLDI